MYCDRTAKANDPAAHLIERMDRLQVEMSHIKGEVEKLQLRVRWERYAMFLFGIVFGDLFSRWEVVIVAWE